MTWKKWIYLLLAVAITGYIFFFYISFNGNPISKAIAKNYATDYLEKYYSHHNYSIKESGYNFKDKSYYFYYIVKEKNDQVYNYSIEIGKGLKPDQILYNSLRSDSEDVEMSRSFSEDGTVYAQKILKEAKIDGEVYYYVQVPLGYIDAHTKWSPEIELPLLADIRVYTEQSFDSKKDFFKYVKEVEKALDGILYNQLYIESVIPSTIEEMETFTRAYWTTIEYREKAMLKNIKAVE